ncbi:MAG: hypothetical protein HY319_22010 [Armatimonadetes bacterium]|nr:hypothetical protein [Armatimonadota bacterium]
MSIAGGPNSNFNLQQQLASIQKPGSAETRSAASSSGANAQIARTNKGPKETGVLSPKALQELEKANQTQADLANVGDDQQEQQHIHHHMGQHGASELHDDEEDIQARRRRGQEIDEEIRSGKATILGADGRPVEVPVDDAMRIKELDNDEHASRLYDGYGRPLKDHEIQAAENYLVQSGVIDKAERGKPIDMVTSQDVDQAATRMELQRTPDPQAGKPLLEPHDSSHGPISLELPPETEQVAREMAARKLQNGEVGEALIVGPHGETLVSRDRSKQGEGSARPQLLDAHGEPVSRVENPLPAPEPPRAVQVEETHAPAPPPAEAPRAEKVESVAEKTPVVSLDTLESFRETRQSLNGEMGQLFMQLPDQEKAGLKEGLAKASQGATTPDARADRYADVLLPYSAARMAEIARDKGQNLQTLDQVKAFAARDPEYAHFGLLAGTTALGLQTSQLMNSLQALPAEDRQAINQRAAENLKQVAAERGVPAERLDRSLISAQTIKEFAAGKVVEHGPKDGKVFGSAEEEARYAQQNPRYGQYAGLWAQSNEFLNMSQGLAEGKQNMPAQLPFQGPQAENVRSEPQPAQPPPVTAYTGEASRMAAAMDQQVAGLPQAEQQELGKRIQSAASEARGGYDPAALKAWVTSDYAHERLLQEAQTATGKEVGHGQGKPGPNQLSGPEINQLVQTNPVVGRYARLADAAQGYLGIRNEEASDLSNPVDPRSAQGPDLVRPSVVQHYGSQLAALLRGAGVQGLPKGPAQAPPPHIQVQQDRETGNVSIRNTQNGAQWNMLPPEAVDTMANNPVQYRNWVNTLDADGKKTVLDGMDQIRSVLDGTPPRGPGRVPGGYTPQQAGGIPSWAQQQQGPPPDMGGWDTGYYHPNGGQGMDSMSKMMMLMQVMNSMTSMLMMIPMMSMSMMPFPMMSFMSPMSFF